MSIGCEAPNTRHEVVAFHLQHGRPRSVCLETVQRLRRRTARAPDSIPAKNIPRATFVTVGASLVIARDCEDAARYLATSNNQRLSAREAVQLAMNRSVWRSYVTAISAVQRRRRRWFNIML